MKRRFKTLTLAALLGSSVLYAESLYTGTYLQSSGIVSPSIGTGIPNPLSVKALKQKRMTMHTSLYTNFKGQLTQESLKALDEIISYAKAHNATISLIGHTSSYTKEDQYVPLSFWGSIWHNISNKKMSEVVIVDDVNARIHQAYDILTAKGISPRKIYTENRMDRDPLSTEATTEGRKRNRRVDVGVWR
jgi:hypothetical protein